MFYDTQNDFDIIDKPKHIKSVLKEIKSNFVPYFEEFLATEAGSTPSTEEFLKALATIGVDAPQPKMQLSKQRASKAFKNIIKKGIEEFEKDQDFYIDLFDFDILEEHLEDTENFKNTVLRNKCPILCKTLHSTSEKLKKFKIDFTQANANGLYKVIYNLSSFADEYAEEFSNNDDYEKISCWNDLGLTDLEYGDLESLQETGYDILTEIDEYEEDYRYPSVIGPGISSHFLYKNYPSLFPNRSQNSIWAMWFLTAQKSFDCQEDSEFLMIKSTTAENNYLYPYCLYTWYAFNIYKMLKENAEQLDVYIDPDYRYVIVNVFMDFIAKIHKNDIETLTRESDSDWMGM